MALHKFRVGDLLRRHNVVIEEVTAKHGGTVVQTEGDGSMLIFSSARRTVACAQTSSKTSVAPSLTARLRRRPRHQ
jgi:class 3 adenylate cyclase